MTILTSEQMWVGRRFMPHYFEVTPEIAAAYHAMFRTGEDDRRFPTGYLAVLARQSYLTEGEMPGGGVMAALGWSVLEPLPVGEPLAIQATVSDRRVRKGRPWIEIDSEITNEMSAVLATTNVIGVWPQ